MALFPIRHVGLKVLSVAVATLLWLVVTGEAVVERSLRVGLELQRTPPGIELVSTVPDAVAVRVRGAASRLADLAPGDLTVVVDLEGVKAGRRLFPLAPSQVTAPFGVEVTQVAPPTLPLEFEVTASTNLPIRARLQGTPIEGHSVTNVSVSPSQVRVEGPESAVRRLTELFTEPVSVDRAGTLIREAVTIDTSDSGLRLVGGSTAVVTVTISADTTVRTVTGVPVRLRGASTGQLTPAEASVTLSGAPEAVEHLTPADIGLFVDVPPGAAGLDVDVQAESSPHYVVKAIDPPRVAYRAVAARRK
ncbi:MAG: CdaR family protein [Vicinamibacterales bacterium]